MLRVTGLGCGLLFLMCWATGCQSERVAFQFQPPIIQREIPAPDSVAAPSFAAVRQPIGPALSGSIAATASAVTQCVHRAHTLGNTSAGIVPKYRKQLFSLRRLPKHVSALAAMQATGSIDDPPWGGIMFLLGIAVAIYAIILGIHLGGWLGLGVGTVLYLAGAYLVARGFAGPGKSASTSPTTGKNRPSGHRNGPQKSLHRPAAIAGLGEIIFTVGNLLLLSALVLGLMSVVTVNGALLLGLAGLLLAGWAYGGIK
jgi:hypothetical protein